MFDILPPNSFARISSSLHWCLSCTHLFASEFLSSLASFAAKSVVTATSSGREWLLSGKTALFAHWVPHAEHHFSFFSGLCPGLHACRQGAAFMHMFGDQPIYSAVPVLKFDPDLHTCMPLCQQWWQQCIHVRSTPDPR